MTDNNCGDIWVLLHPAAQPPRGLLPGLLRLQDLQHCIVQVTIGGDGILPPDRRRAAHRDAARLGP